MLACPLTTRKVCAKVGRNTIGGRGRSSSAKNETYPCTVYPPPTNWTISRRSPAARRVASHFARGRICKLYSMATRPEFKPSCSNRRTTFVPAGASRVSPFTWIRRSFDIEDSERGYASLGPQGKPKLPGTRSMFRADQERSFGARNVRHVEFDQSQALWAGFGAMNLPVMASFDFDENLRARNGTAVFLPHENLQPGMFAAHPRLGIGQFEKQSLRMTRGRGLGYLSGRHLFLAVQTRIRCRRRNIQLQSTRTNLLDDQAVLFIEAKLQSLLAIVVERKQVKVIVCSAVENPALVINRRTNNYFDLLPLDDD